MSSRISSRDEGYTAGDLSVFPEAIDSKETLYEAKNNAATVLKQTLPLNGTYIVVDNASAFPSSGLIRLGPAGAVIPALEQPPDLLNNSGVPGAAGNAELIYYGERTSTIFKSLQRGFAGSRQSQWSKHTPVTCAVFAEHHNAIKDAIINVENYVGTSVSPVDGTLSAKLDALETKYLAPRPLFRAYPISGRPPMTVRFQNFSGSHVLRCLWDFGDGSTSTEVNPIHTYSTEGTYSVALNIITMTGAQGIATKSNYIKVSNEYVEPFFYYVLEEPTSPAYSRATAVALGENPATFVFVDQTLGAVAQRFWDFGDGLSVQVDDPNVHTTTHIYDAPGTYAPTLICVFSDQSYKRTFLTQELTVI